MDLTEPAAIHSDLITRMDEVSGTTKHLLTLANAASQSMARLEEDRSARRRRGPARLQISCVLAWGHSKLAVRLGAGGSPITAGAQNNIAETIMINIKVNGTPHQLDVEGDTPLLWVLREEIGLTGTKFGCGIAQCGACTVHVNGQAMRSCSVPIASLEGAEIITIEGLSRDSTHPVQQAWLTEQVPQCGYCQSGQIMATAAYLKANPNPSNADIDANLTNICRCGTYERLRRAVHRAAALMRA
jgi:isoquinoline 1-oxidoreductase subunit alpha